MPKYIIHITLEEVVEDKHVASVPVTIGRVSMAIGSKGQHTEKIGEESYSFTAPKRRLAFHIFDKIDDRILAAIPLRWRRAR